TICADGEGLTCSGDGGAGSVGEVDVILPDDRLGNGVLSTTGDAEEVEVLRILFVADDAEHGNVVGAGVDHVHIGVDVGVDAAVGARPDDVVVGVDLKEDGAIHIFCGAFGGGAGAPAAGGAGEVVADEAGDARG